MLFCFCVVWFGRECAVHFSIPGVPKKKKTARQALEGAEIAPGNDDTLKKTPARSAGQVPTVPFELDENMFLKNLRSVERGIADLQE